MKISSSKLCLAACTLLTTALLAFGSTVRADTGYTPAGMLTTSGGGYGGGGFDFTLTNTISVTQLAFYAISIGGNDHPHAYLFDVTTGAMLADTGDLSGKLTGNQYNYFTLATPVTLTVGDVYQVSAPAYFVPTYPNTTGFTYGSSIVPVGFYREGSYTGFTQTTPYTTAVATDVPTVANFTYTTVAATAPEPSCVALLAVGGLSVLGGALCRRSRANA